jgi:hypothetical protein
MTVQGGHTCGHSKKLDRSYLDVQVQGQHEAHGWCVSCLC